MKTPRGTLLDKAYAAIALSFAARGAEVTTIMWEDVTQSVNAKTKETTINIRFQRTKVTGVPEKMLALITVRLEVKAIMEYAACFPDEQQRGRYFRKLSATRGGVGITNTKQNVGHNTLAKAAYRIAIRDPVWLGDTTLVHRSHLPPVCCHHLCRIWDETARDRARYW